MNEATYTLTKDIVLALDDLGIEITPHQAQRLTEVVLASEGLGEALTVQDDTEVLVEDTIVSKLAWADGIVREHVEHSLIYRVITNASRRGLSLVSEPVMNVTYEAPGEVAVGKLEDTWTHVRLSCTAMCRPYVRAAQ